MVNNKRAYWRTGNVAVALEGAIDASDEFRPPYFRFRSTRFSITDGGALSSDVTTEEKDYGIDAFLTFADCKAFLKAEIETLAKFVETPSLSDAFIGFDEAKAAEKWREILGAWQGLESQVYAMDAEGFDFDAKLMGIFHQHWGEDWKPDFFTEKQLVHG